MKARHVIAVALVAALWTLAALIAARAAQCPPPPPEGWGW